MISFLCTKEEIFAPAFAQFAGEECGASDRPFSVMPSADRMLRHPGNWLKRPIAGCSAARRLIALFTWKDSLKIFATDFGS